MRFREFVSVPRCQHVFLCCHLLFVICTALTIRLCVSLCRSFICVIFLMCKVVFLRVLIIVSGPVIVPYLRPVFNMCVEYPEMLLLFLIANV
jgi:hypothetical protein